jgi:anthranilate synthase component 2
MVHHDGEGLFRGVPQEFTATRYHSLILDASKLSSELLPTAWSHHGNEKILMGLRHEVRPIAGVQFHPESFLTDNGAAFMENFIKWVNPVLS